MPLAAMTVGGGSGLFYVILLLCLFRCLTREGGWRETMHGLRPYAALIGALAVPLCAIGLSQYAHGSFHGPSLERGLRISLGFPIVLGALLSIDPARLRNAYWGIAAAGWASAGIVFWLALPAWNRPNTPQYNAVGYGSLMALWLFITLYGLGWALSKRPRLEKHFKILTAVVIFAGFILTQTRTGWMALPLFLFLGMWLFGHMRRPLRAFGLLAAVLAVLVALGSANQALRTRVMQGVQELQECHGAKATADTSVCIRLQLWRASVQMIEAEPLFGLGSPARFAPELQARVATGVVSPFVAQDFGEPHNDMLHMLSSYGLLGGLGLVLLYGAPACVFLRRLTTANPAPIRVAAAMGTALVLGFAIFGLTELMFRSMQNVSLYITLLAWFLALCHKHQDTRAQAPL
jgi:O-antigen ligase